MKKCPTCQKTFDDNMRFCQTDGTPLVEATESPDPYATMVASKDEIAAAIPPGESSSIASPPNDDDLPDISDSADDPMKTSVVTEAEMREMTFGKDSREKDSSEPFNADATFVESSKPSAPDFSSPPSSVPKFDEPKLNPPSFGASPFSDPKSDTPDTSQPPKKADDSSHSSPIPSPFGEKMPPSYQTPSTSPFAPPEFNEEEIKAEALNTPFAEEVSQGNQQVAQNEWTPPVSPSSGFGESSNTGNPPNAAAGQSNTLAIVSLVLGILSIPCCGFIVIGIAAIITGFMAKNKADNNPNEFGGRNLALAGMGIGALTTLIGIITNLLALLGFIPIPTF